MILANQARTLDVGPYLSEARHGVVLAQHNDLERARVARELRQNGWDVTELEDGMELVDYLDELQSLRPPAAPAVIIADVALDGYSGLEACAYLRELDSETPFILIAASKTSTAFVEAERVGATFVLEEPLDLDDLCDVVSAYADGVDVPQSPASEALHVLRM